MSGIASIRGRELLVHSFFGSLILHVFFFGFGIMITILVIFRGSVIFRWDWSGWIFRFLAFVLVDIPSILPSFLILFPRMNVGETLTLICSCKKVRNFRGER